MNATSIISREGENYSISGNSTININTSQLKRDGKTESSMIKQQDESNIEISASNLSNSIGHCVEKFGENSKTTCNAIKTKIDENYNIIQGEGGQFIQSESQCLIGSSKTNITPVNVPNEVTLT